LYCATLQLFCLFDETEHPESSMKEVITAALALVLAAATPLADTNYASIAYSVSTQTFGSSNDAPHKRGATGAAVADCKESSGGSMDCREVISTFGRSCIALATIGSDRSVTGVGVGPDLSAARAAASKACSRAGGKACDRLLTSTCSYE
jgi:Domain of unknown function (DUF4189)